MGKKRMSLSEKWAAKKKKIKDRLARKKAKLKEKFKGKTKPEPELEGVLSDIEGSTKE